MFVDSHCHLEMEAYDKDRTEVIARSVQEGLSYILTVGTEERYFDKVRELTEKYTFIYGAIGIHPHNSGEVDERSIRKIEGALKHEKVVAYGEIGLDFFRDYSPREIQKQAFRTQMMVAQQSGLPVIIHSRNAKEETLRILRETSNGNVTGVIHCYSYDVATAALFLDMGFHISIPGTITYKNSKEQADVVRYVPVDRLLAETDAPFLTPHPYRGKRNEPHFVKLTIARIAEIKEMDVMELAELICDNFVKLFLNKG